MTYLITFSCYGHRLHGSDQGSVNRIHNAPRTPVIDPNPGWVKAGQERMDQPAYELNSTRRDVVLAAIREVCTQRGWTLLAAHVRRTHVHVVVSAEALAGQSDEYM